MNWTHKKKVYRAVCLQWTGDNTEQVAAMLRELGYTGFEMYKDTIMARAEDKPLLCVHPLNWLRIGENGEFKMMRPDEFELKYEVIEDDRRVLQARGEHPSPCARFCEANAYQIAERGYKSQIERLSAANKDLQSWFDAAKSELDALKSQNPCSYEVYSRDTVEFSASYEQACHEHINCAIVDYDVDGADNWKVRPVYARPVPAIPDSYVLTPINPSEAMIDAGFDAVSSPLYTSGQMLAEMVYKAMIAASQKEVAP